MKIVCASSMPFVREAFETLGETVVLGGRDISADDVRDADLLAIRSTTEVNRELMEGSRVRFVGTATIGIDHLDTELLESRGIGWCYSPGCNATSVSEYVTVALLRLAVRHSFSLRGMTIGVIGVGNVGRLVVEKARALGMTVLQNDPPRARSEGDTEFTELEEVLNRADIVSLHVPLTKTGSDATFHMADNEFFSRVRPGLILINAARGAVVETAALLDAMASGAIAHAVIDTWENEPRVSMGLLRKIDIGTPHIAGHSFDGKVAGTVMVYQAACRFLGVKPAWTPDRLLPPPEVRELSVDAAGRSDEAALDEMVRRVYDISRDDADLRKGDDPDVDQRAKHFEALRTNYPVRREFRFTRVTVGKASAELTARIAGLGFEVG